MLGQKQENCFIFKPNLQFCLRKGVIHLNVFNIEKEKDLFSVIIQYSPGSLVSIEAQMLADIKIIIGVNTEPFHRECVQ